MLDAFIIQELKRREQERLKKERARPVLELPVPGSNDRGRDRPRDEQKPNTVVHIDI